MKLQVIRKVDGSHAPTTEFSLDGVAVRQRSFQAFQHVSHRDGSRLATGLTYGLGLLTARLACENNEKAERVPACLRRHEPESYLLLEAMLRRPKQGVTMSQDELAAFKKKLAESETLRSEFVRFAAEKIGLDADALDDSELDEVAGGFGLPLPRQEASAVNELSDLNGSAASAFAKQASAAGYADVDAASLLTEFMKLQQNG